VRSSTSSSRHVVVHGIVIGRVVVNGFVIGVCIVIRRIVIVQLVVVAASSSVAPVHHRPQCNCRHRHRRRRIQPRRATGVPKKGSARRHHLFSIHVAAGVDLAEVNDMGAGALARRAAGHVLPQINRAPIRAVGGEPVFTATMSACASAYRSANPPTVTTILIAINKATNQQQYCVLRTFAMGSP
jgi:hypothetical protein